MMPLRPISTMDKLHHLVNLSFELTVVKTFHSPKEARRLYYTLAMSHVHSPTVPYLRCGYMPYHYKNESALRQILENIDALLIPQNTGQPRRRKDDIMFIFLPESLDAINKHINELVSLLLEERMMGYITVALKWIAALRIWQNSQYSNMSWEEIDQVVHESSVSASSILSPLQNKLLEISGKIGIDINVITDWIHLYVNSTVSGGSQFILDVIDDHDLHALASRVSADQTALNFFEIFYSGEKLVPYRQAHRWFRDFWFLGPLNIHGYSSLREDVYEWLHRLYCCYC